MKLVDRKGVVHKVDIGLTDKDGAFFLLLDDDEPSAYFKYSNESALITSQQEEIRKLRNEINALRGRLDAANIEMAKDGTVSIACAATLLGLTRKYTRKLLSAHKLGRTKRDGEFVVPLSCIEEYQKGKHQPDA